MRSHLTRQPGNGKYQPKNGKYHPPAPAPELLSPQQAPREAVAAVFTNLGTIVQAMIGKAAEGSHLHAKLLFDFAGISAASLAPESEAEQPSLARLFLEKLDQMAKETAAAEDERPVE
jgi:hypothetical protein